MSEHPINELMATTIEKLRELANSETVIGNPIKVSETTTIIPVSKLSIGFASGGSDFPSKNPKELFGGGGGAGVTVTPKAFLVVENGNVRLLQLAKDGESIDRLCNMIPDAINQISSLIKKDKTEAE
ncbi:MAG: GerW family sporulation protein [Oscillospiraceae bacterium]|nr:GerW family sporulation protein [Oscillospiraceae bacterium]MBQ5816297.1 GerW family sporulation protein [Oscillospiraceae bacterium]